MPSYTPQETIFDSLLGGFGNTPTTTMSVAVPSQNIGSFGGVNYIATTSLTNANRVVGAQIQYAGIDSSWYLLDGFNENTTSPTFSLSTTLYFTANSVSANTFIFNGSFSSAILPALTITVEVTLYVAPF